MLAHLAAGEHGAPYAQDPLHTTVLAVSRLLKLPHGPAQSARLEKHRLLVGNPGRETLSLEGWPVRTKRAKRQKSTGHAQHRVFRNVRIA